MITDDSSDEVVNDDIISSETSEDDDFACKSASCKVSFWIYICNM